MVPSTDWLIKVAAVSLQVRDNQQRLCACPLVHVCVYVWCCGYLNKGNLEEIWKEMRVMAEEAAERDKVGINQKQQMGIGRRRCRVRGKEREISGSDRIFVPLN